MQVIGWCLIWTVVVAYIYALVERYWHVLLILAGDALLGVLALLVLALIMRAVWSGLCHWRELQQIRIQANRAIQRTNAHYDQAQAEMEQLARDYHIRKGISS